MKDCCLKKLTDLMVGDYVYYEKEILKGSISLLHFHNNKRPKATQPSCGIGFRTDAWNRTPCETSRLETPPSGWGAQFPDGQGAVSRPNARAAAHWQAHEFIRGWLTEDEYEPSVGLEIVKIDNGDDINLAIEECYRGIPLSDDSLAKFGFKKVTDKALDPFNEGTELTMHVAEFEEQLSGDGVATNRVVVYPNGTVSIDSATGHVTVHCEYIHEIQHAMRVAGIKEELLLTEGEPVKCLLHSSFQEFNQWHDNEKYDIWDSFNDWECHNFTCKMKDGNVVKFIGICDETAEGEIHKHIDCTDADYDTDEIRYWFETT